MKNYILICALLSIGFSDSDNKKNYVIDLKNSKLRWYAKKLISSHWGNVDLKSATIDLNGNQPVSGEFVVDMKTIKVMDMRGSPWVSKLESHLHSKDFFDTAKFPEATFIIKKVKMKNGTFFIDGDLTIKDIKHPIEFGCIIIQSENSTLATGIIEIDRTLYDITHRSGRYFPDIGDRMIHDIFTINFEIITQQ